MEINKLQEWEVISQCNYNCFYCSLPNYKMELNEDILKKFMDNIDKDLELFVFGGEPFMHKKIKFIIDYLNKIKQPFVIQSNISTKSIDIIKNNINNFNLQCSVHPTEITETDLINNLIELKRLNDLKILNMKRIDIMYIGKESIRYYRIVQKIFPEICYLLPISGFYKNNKNLCCALNKEYNIIRYKKIYSWIKFEENYILGESKFRSELWEEQCSGKFSTYGKPCPYDYVLWDSKLNKYNCCYREITNGYCTKNGCFWM